MKHQLMTVEEVAAELRIHPETVREKLRSGALKGVKIGKAWRIRREDFERFVNQ